MSATLIPCVCGGVWSDDNDPEFKAHDSSIDSAVRHGLKSLASVSPVGSLPFDSRFCVIRRDIATTHVMMSAVEQILADSCPKVRAAAAQNFVISPTRLVRLMDDESFEVRRALWLRDDLPDAMHGVLEQEFS